MVSNPVVCTPSIQMAANQCKCCVTWSRTVEAGQFFERRLDGSVDFFLGWESYKNGFGNLCGEFWFGNDNLHRLTASGDVTLRVDLEDFEGDIRYAEYKTFTVADEADKYRLSIGEYTGTAGDSFSYHK